ncbi:N-acetylglucosamine kinase [Myroides sp. LJL119]
MRLIVDSGSTKADWICLDVNQNVMESVTTLGLNPEVLNASEFLERIDNNAVLKQISPQVSQVFFYGAGCASLRTKTMVNDILCRYFVNSKHNEVHEDTYAAVFASVQKGESGIVCINGTGSNASYFDGKQLHPLIESLGYMAMDDCSGSSFGRMILKSYFLNLMPEDLAFAFKQQYQLDADQVKFNFYKKENPNAYMASFLPFLIKYKNHAFFQEMIKKEISYFRDAYLKNYPQIYNTSVYFVGSVAYLLQEEFTDVLSQTGIPIGTFIQKPLDGLIQYHKKK